MLEESDLSDRFNEGDVVWAKFAKNFWPAQILGVHRSGDESKVTVKFFDEAGDREDTDDSLPISNVRLWSDENVKKFRKQSDDLDSVLKEQFDDALVAAQKKKSEATRQVKEGEAGSGEESDKDSSEDEVDDLSDFDNLDEDDGIDGLVEFQTPPTAARQAEFTVGQIVWMKVPGHKYWPSQVVKLMYKGKKRTYSCKMYEWLSDNGKEEVYTVKHNNVKRDMEIYIKDSEDSIRRIAEAKKDKLVLKHMGNDPEKASDFVDRAVNAAERDLLRDSPDSNQESFELPESGAKDSESVEKDTEVSSVTTIETITVTKRVAKRSQEKVEYVRRCLDDVSDEDEEQRAKRLRTDDTYSENEIQRALKDRILKGELLEIWRKERLTDLSESFASLSAKEKKDRELMVPKWGKIHDQEWNDFFSEHLDSALQILESENRYFYWKVLIQEAVWRVHAQLDNISLKDAKQLVARIC